MLSRSISQRTQSLMCFSADPDQDWTPTFASLDDPFGLLHKLVRASDLTICLERCCEPDTSRGRQTHAFEVGMWKGWRSSLMCFRVSAFACSDFMDALVQPRLRPCRPVFVLVPIYSKALWPTHNRSLCSQWLASLACRYNVNIRF